MQEITSQESVSLASKTYPKSLSVADMMRLGKVIDKETATRVDLYSFNLDKMA